MYSQDIHSVEKQKWTETSIKEYSSRLMENNVPVIFDVEHLRRLIKIKKNVFYNILFKIDYQYHEIDIPKKRLGEFRTLSLPSKKVKVMQRWILDNVLYNIECRNEVTGFVPGKSIVDNAKPHISKDYILKLDIEDFFPSINGYDVFLLFNNLGYTNKLSSVMSRICVFKDKLPQGGPSSPYIANLVCRNLDDRINSICKTHSLNYSRYADDITISGNKKVCELKMDFISIIEEEHFSINWKKVRILKNGYRKRVTGIVVNEKLSVPKEIIRDMRKVIYFINKFGLNSHMEKTGIIERSNYKEYLYGQARYIYMIDKNYGKKFIAQLELINWD